MSVFDDIYNSDGEKLYHRAQSKTYSLKEISDYLLACMSEPQNDTKISFEIRDDGEIYISTSNVDEFTTMSFKIRKSHLKKLRDYAFTNRLEIKEALDEALAQYLDPIDDSELMEYPEKPKKTRKRG